MTKRCQIAARVQDVPAGPRTGDIPETGDEGQAAMGERADAVPADAGIDTVACGVGTGLAGLAAALALASRGVLTVLVGPHPDTGAMARDTRSTALFGPSLDFLRNVGVMQRLDGGGEPLAGLRLIDATGGLLRAPEVLFEAQELGLAAFGANIENQALLGALAAAAAAHPAIRWRTQVATGIESAESGVTVRLADGAVVRAAVVVGADGAQSACRAAAGIGARSWSYPQVALATRFSHTRPHAGISTELHRRAGPLTTVPLAGLASSLVWVETPAEAARLMALGDDDFARELEDGLGSMLGAVGDIGTRASFPISGVTAERLGARRIALVGEAAHRLPPIGAQGLNLGLRDAAWLADLVGSAVADGRDPGGADVLEGYERARRSDILSRTAVVDALNRSLVADLLPVDVARGAGLAALKAFGPLRRLFMREGMAPAGELPSLMRPGCDSREIAI